MRGSCRVILLATAGADADLRYSANGAAICTARVATNESWNDKQSGERQERTEWYRLKFFGKLAEIAGEYIKKGKQVYIEGALRTDKYTDKDGIERVSTDIIVSELQLLGGGERQAGDGQQRASNGGQRDSRGSPPQNRTHSSSGSRAPARSNQRAPVPAGDFEDDEIPFDRAARGPR